MTAVEAAGPTARAGIVPHLAIILLVYAIMAAVRIAAPSDIELDQAKQLDYICDIVENGAWAVQHLRHGEVASKPPLYNWLAAGPILLTNAWTDFLLKLPSLVAGLGVLLLTWDIARRLAGNGPALIAALLLATTGLYVKTFYFARTDRLLAMFMTAQIWAAVARRPVVLWSAAALGMLTKGPVGLLTVAALLAWWWWRGHLLSSWREMKLNIGLPLSLVPFAIWFLVALSVEGRPLFDQLVVAETVDRFLPGAHYREHKPAYYYIPHFFARMAPASLFSVLAILALPWRTDRREALFLAAFWLLTLFVIFSLIPSKRVDRILPILPAASILAGWAIHNQIRGVNALLLAGAALLLAAGVMVALGFPASLFDPARTNAPHLIRGAGAVLALSGGAMLAFLLTDRRTLGIGMLIVSMMVVVTTYEHWLGRGVRAGEIRPVCAVP